MSDFIILHDSLASDREVVINKNHIVKLASYFPNDDKENGETAYIQLTVPLAKTYSSAPDNFLYPKESYEEIRKMLIT